MKKFIKIILVSFLIIIFIFSFIYRKNFLIYNSKEAGYEIIKHIDLGYAQGQLEGGVKFNTPNGKIGWINKGRPSRFIVASSWGLIEANLSPGSIGSTERLYFADCKEANKYYKIKVYKDIGITKYDVFNRLTGKYVISKYKIRELSFQIEAEEQK